MNKPSFFEGVALALTAALLGSILYTALAAFVSTGALLRLLITGIGLAYVVYLLVRSRERVGRVTALAGWILMTGSTWLLEPPLPLYLLVHLGLVWLIRSIYFYSSLLSALADLALTGLGLAAGIWAATQTGSLFLSLWCFFLVQALFVAIPVTMNLNTAPGSSEQDREDRFQHAHRVAESALRRLSSLR